MNWAVTGIAAVAVLIVVVWGLAFSSSFEQVAAHALDFVVKDFGWLFIAAGTAFVAFVFFIAMSKFGHIRLGKDTDRPEFSTVSWVSMMFAAGMGIGLMFYGSTEPLTFFRDGVPGREPHDEGAAFASTIFHWGLHPWALYAIVALGIAYSSYRLGNKQLLSSAFIPLIGRKAADGVPGTVIDVLAIFATVFGTAASLGLGALQIQSGLQATGFVDGPSQVLVIGIVVVLSICFLISAFSGVSKGIQLMSNINMVLAALLALFVFVVGPTVVILNYMPSAFNNYLAQFFEMASRTTNSSEETATWLNGWTIFYWAWWTSWSPFVGMFLARISRGRTIREFVFVVLLVPTLVSVVWFSVFGGSAIHFEKLGQSIWGNGDSTSQLFSLLDQFPASTVMSVLAMVLLATFFITSADSASTVMGSMSQNGRAVASPVVTVLWGVLTATIAVVMLTMGGAEALTNLQNLTIIAASPFVIIILALTVAIVKGLSDDPLYLADKESRRYALKLAHQRRMSAKRQGAWRAASANAKGNDAVLGRVGDSEVLPVHDVATANGTVEVVKVEDIKEIVEQAQEAVYVAQEAANAAAASADLAEASAEAVESAADESPSTSGAAEARDGAADKSRKS